MLLDNRAINEGSTEELNNANGKKQNLQRL
jgi:hypothetical protein